MPRSRTAALFLVGLSCVGFVSLGLPDGVLGVAWPSIRGTFGLPLDALGALLVTSSIGYVASSFSSGPILARMSVGALLAASTGVVGATVVTMGLISLPAMLRAGYDPKLACGVICASGTLGQIVPPSTVLIFMGDMLGGINSQVQMAKGNFAPSPVSVGDLFVGALLPSMVLIGLYVLYLIYKAIFDAKSCPAAPGTAAMSPVTVTKICAARAHVWP